MSNKVKSIRSDPRWIALVEKYRYNWIDAPVALFGVEPTFQQLELLRAAQVEGCRVTTTSGHGVGKSSITAIIALMYMLFFSGARVVLIANKLDQVKIAVFKNIRVYFKTLVRRLPWIEQYFVLTDTTFYQIENKGVWELSAKAYRIGHEESLSGEHSARYLVIVDEASGLSDAAFSFISSGLTERDNRLILLSQPTRSSGFFWRTHNDPAIMRDWTRIKFNSEQSPLVTDQFILMKFREYGMNRNNPEYMIKIRGEFSKNLSGFLLSSDDCIKATQAKPKLDYDWGWAFCCDVGNTRDSSIINICRVSGYGTTRRVVTHKVIEYEGTIDPVNFGRMIVNEYRSYNYVNAVVLIDCDGIGVSSAVVVEEEGIAVQRVRWGFPCFSDEEKKRFQDIRAMCTVAAKDAVTSGRMRIDMNAKTREQASKIPYLIDHRGRFVIVSKKDMKNKFSLSSPDRWDTYCFMMLADITPANILIDSSTIKEREDAGNWVSIIDVA